MSGAHVDSMDAVVPKSEPLQDGYSSSTPSTPEAEAEVEAEASTQDVVQVQKRKGGRKPIYATSEERKQRNRQAQAAFRERRTEYIKQLENTIKHHEETLQTLQQSHRSAADECLMLRYKNSLLERILLEKGIDVQAELRVKGSPHVGPTKPSHPSPIQRAMMNRQQQASRNSALGPPPTLQPTIAMASAGGDGAFSSPSSLQPTPTSQTSSPSTSRSPGYPMPGGVSSPQSDSHAQQQPSHPQPPVPQQHPKLQQPQPPNRHLPPQHHNRFPQYPSLSQPQTSEIPTIPPSQAMIPPRTKSQTSSSRSTFYHPSFQKHYDQLDQEYDAIADLMEETEAVDGESGNFPPTYPIHHPSTNPAMELHTSPTMMQTPGSDPGAGAQSGGLAQMFDPFDAMLDADPFGLSASMHFPTPFDYDQSQARR